MTRYLSLITLIAILSSCTKQPRQQLESFTTEAELLQLEQLDNNRTLCRIMNPWKEEEVAMQYLLVDKSDKNWSEQKEKEYAELYGSSVTLRTPLERQTITSSCHAWLLSQLDALNSIAVMCDTAYVKAENLKRWMRNANAHVLDGGNAMAPNAEVILSAQSDAIWVSPFENATAGSLVNLPIPVIYCADYMEHSALGRAEWMRFYGRLVGKGEEADALFETVSEKYRSSSPATTNGFYLLAELPYGATWYVPGGHSTSAEIYMNAGYYYLWEDDNHAGSLSLSREAVLAQAADADVWIFKYNDPAHDWTLDDLKRQEDMFGQIKAVKEGRVLTCNTAFSDFFDVTPFRPDTLLNSLVSWDEAFFKVLK